MSKKDARKITVIEYLLDGKYSIKQAAQLLNLSERQIIRLKQEADKNGTLSLIHKNRSRRPHNTLNPEIAKEICSIYKTELNGYNFSHAKDVLAEEKNIEVSVSTLRRYLEKEGIKSPKAKRRPKAHRSRNPREKEGELVQMDASKHDWLSNGSYLHLHGCIDDARSKVLALYFDKEETSNAYVECMMQMNHKTGLPKEVYTDGRTIFVYDSVKKAKLTLDEELAGITEKQPQFARALKELGVLHTVAGSPQAKGRNERLWGTLQDRLVKDMQREGIDTIEKANEFLKTYIAKHNKRFAVKAESNEKAYLPKKTDMQLKLAFAKHEYRKLDSGLSFRYNGSKYSIPASQGDKKVPLSAHSTITVVDSPHFGLRVLCDDMLIIPKELITPSNASVLKNSEKSNTSNKPKVAKEERPKKTSPWYDYNTLFYSKAKLDDIYAD